MRRILALLLLSAVYVASDDKIDKYDKHPEHLLHNYGGLYPYDYGSLNTLIALKIKAALLVGALIFGVYWFYSIYVHKGYKCRTHYPYHHDDRIGPSESHGPYKTARAEDPSFIQRITEGIDLVDLSFNLMNVKSDACRRKFVCEVDQVASRNHLLGYAVNMFSETLSSYRNMGSKNISKDCASLYPECTSTVDGTALHENEVSPMHHIVIQKNQRLLAS